MNCPLGPKRVAVQRVVRCREVAVTGGSTEVALRLEQ